MMKKLLWTVFVLTVFNSAHGQSRATLENDTAKYDGRTFTLGDTILLSYGSKSNKDFGFIKTGSALMGFTDLNKSFSKFEVVIDKLYKQSKSVYLRARFVDKTYDVGGAYKLVIDLEGAVDNKELR